MTDEFATLFHNSPNGVAIAHDAACRRITCNAAMLRLFGDAALHACGAVTVWHQGRKLDAHAQPLQRACLHGETVQSMELEVRAEGEPAVYVLANAVPLLDDAGRRRGAIATAVDVTALKTAEVRRVEATNRARDEFLNMLGHELRNPLGAITAAADVLGSGADGTATGNRALAIIARQARYLSERVARLLDAGRTAGATAAAASPQAAPFVLPACGFAIRPLSIALLEDDEGLQDALRAALQRDGHEVRAHGYDDAGLALLLKHRPDAAIVDVGLPGLTGFDVARRARAGGYAGRMVAISDPSRLYGLPDARKAGFDSYLVTPVNIEQLRASLRDDA